MVKNIFSLLLLLITVVACTEQEKEVEEHHLKLFYQHPAEAWTEALPVGNGRMAAMVYGNPSREHIQFNEETLWTGEPHSYAHQGAYNYLGEIRQLLEEGKQAEAEELAMEEFMSVPLGQMAYQPFGDIFIEFPGHEAYQHYRRELDLKNALAKNTYSVDQTTYTREILACYPDNVIAIHLSADTDAALTFNVALSTAHEMQQLQANDDELTLEVQVKDGALHGFSRLWVQTEGGTISTADNQLMVKDADAATLILSAATNYVKYNDVSGNPSQITQNTIDKVQPLSYTDIKEKHRADYQELFNRFAIDFGENEKVNLPTGERIMHFWKEQNDPQLLALYVQYGRYLMISSSRPGSHPANLQGKWNDQMEPPWDSKYTVNINTEMNYWPVEVTNLSECHTPLFSMIADCAETGHEVAREHYHADGWVLHHNTDVWRGTASINHSNHGIWVSGGAWLCQHLWEHYRFTLDKEFLRATAYPLMKGAAQFFVDFLVEDETTGWLISTPSNSPENGGLVAGPSMDHQIIRQLFRNCIAAADTLGIDSDFAGVLQNKLDSIAPNQMGQYGQLQEWLEDKDDPDSHHRHVSHLWAVYPGVEINWHTTPDLMEAAKKSLTMRGDEGTGWSLAWKINFWARFLDGEHAYNMIAMLLSPAEHEERNIRGGSYPNLFDAHPPFQIDGNFGGTSGIIELLLQSHLGELHLLPALPTALNNGSLQGACARGGFVVDMDWEAGKPTRVHILSKGGKTCKIRFQDKVVEFPTEAGKTYALGEDFEL